MKKMPSFVKTPMGVLLLAVVAGALVAFAAAAVLFIPKDRTGEREQDLRLQELIQSRTAVPVGQDTVVTFTIGAANAGEIALLDTNRGERGVFNDEGEDGDEEADDGTWTCQIHTRKNEPTSETFYARATYPVSSIEMKAGVPTVVESDKVTITSVPKPTEEQVLRAAQLSSELNDLGNRFLSQDETGYSSLRTVELRGRELMDSGEALASVRSRVAVTITLSSGINVAYAPRREGTLPGENEIRRGVFTWSKETKEDEAKQGIDRAIEGERMSDMIAACTDVPAHSVVVLQGNVLFRIKAPTLLDTGLSGEEFLKRDGLRDKTLVDNNMAFYNGHLYTSAETISTIIGHTAFNDCILWLNVPFVGKGTSIPGFYITSGAASVVSPTVGTTTQYAHDLCRATLTRLTTQIGETGRLYTLAEALAGAKDEVGGTDAKYINSTFDITGKGGVRLDTLANSAKGATVYDSLVKSYRGFKDAGFSLQYLNDHANIAEKGRALVASVPRLDSLWYAIHDINDDGNAELLVAYGTGSDPNQVFTLFDVRTQAGGAAVDPLKDVRVGVSGATEPNLAAGLLVCSGGAIATQSASQGSSEHCYLQLDPGASRAHMLEGYTKLTDGNAAQYRTIDADWAEQGASAEDVVAMVSRHEPIAGIAWMRL